MSASSFTVSSRGESVPADVAPELPYESGVIDVEVFTATGAVMNRSLGFPPRSGSEGNVLKHSSILKTSSIRDLARKYFFPPSWRLMTPRPCDRACSPPTGYVTVFEDCLRFGLRFPLNSVVRALLDKFKILLGQLMPNTFKHLSVLGVEAYERGIPFTIDLVLQFFQLKTLSGSFYLSPRPGSGIRAKTSSKLSRWQQKFFFCRADCVPEYKWKAGGVRDPGPGDSEDPGHPLAELGQISRDYTEAELSAAGLSPYRPDVDVDPGEDDTFYF